MGKKQVIEEIILKVRLDDKQSKKGLKGLGDETKKTTKKVDQLGKAFKIIGGLVIANQLRNIASSAIEVADSFTRLENSLQTTFGSMQAANEQMSFLDENAKRLGVDLIATSKGFGLVAASGKAAGLSTKEIQDIFTGASEASAALSLSSENTNGVLLAFSQILSKGKVQAEELRGQIGERLPGAFNIAAESMGLTTAELDKLMQSGDLASNDFMPAFAAALRETFHEGAMNNATKSIAQATRNQNEWNKSLREMGGPLKEVSTGIGSFLIDALGIAADLAAKNQDFLVGLIVGFDEVRKATNKAVDAMGDFGPITADAAKKVDKLSKSIIALNAIEVKLEAAQELDDLRDKLGLTERGFAVLAKGFGGGKALLKLFSDKDVKTQEKFFENVNKILGAQKGGSGQFFKINQEDIEFAKMLEKWGTGTFDPTLGLGTELFDSLGKIGDFAKAEEQKDKAIVDRGPIEGIEGRSAEALRFAARPVEKNMEKIAEEQLVVQRGIETGINNLAMQTVNTEGL